MSKLDPTKLKKLKAQWDKKLKASGFVDIENYRGEFKDHKTLNDLFRLIGFRTGFMEDIRDYYTWAMGEVLLAEFETKRDRKIWTMHASGISSREIAKEVNIKQGMVCRQIKKIRAYLKARKPSELEGFDYFEGAA